MMTRAESFASSLHSVVVRATGTTFVQKEAEQAAKKMTMAITPLLAGQ